MVFNVKNSTLSHKCQGFEGTDMSDVIRPKYLGLGYKGLIYIQKSSATGRGRF